MENQTQKFIDSYKNQFVDLFYSWGISALEQGADAEIIFFQTMQYNLLGHVEVTK